MTKLENLLEAARQATGPSIVAPSKVVHGGVDPLGLRQINFDLMDRVLPDLNNVARQVRPYILMSWAWRRVWTIMERSGKEREDPELLRDFVDRIEAIYAWSQFLRDPKADLPGRQALGYLLNAQSFRFEGEAWTKPRNTRRVSTGLISALNYGPSLRTMGWLLPVHGHYDIYRTAPDLNEALDAFEEGFRGELHHEAFSKLGAVTVEQRDVLRWGRLWALDQATPAEAEVMHRRLCGVAANPTRRRGVELIEAACADLGEEALGLGALRLRMADLDGMWQDAGRRPPISDDWRQLQTRQLFRLALEALFGWTVGQLLEGPRPTAWLATKFLDDVQMSGVPSIPERAEDWLLSSGDEENPVIGIERLEKALVDPAHVPQAIASALSLCLCQATGKAHGLGRTERLPLARARQNALSWGLLPPRDFMIRVLDHWIMAQHTYWSVTRGISDARGSQRTILRLRVVMDEGGWALTPGTTRQGGRPAPTGDRLRTALVLFQASRP